MKPRDKWRDLFIIAEGDYEAFRILANMTGRPLALSAFHAQQAVEKYFKSVIGSRGIDYPYTHDLVALIEILENNGFILPFPREQVEKLNPFAVQIRYDLPPIIPINRKEIEEIVNLVAHWCKEQLHD